MKKYLLPCGLTLGIILVGCLISSIFYYFNITSDKFNMILLYLISISAIFAGSLTLAKELKQKGLITGLAYFGAWFVVMLFASLVIFKSQFNVNSLIYYLVLLGFSLLGAITGKNMQNEINTD